MDKVQLSDQRLQQLTSPNFCIRIIDAKACCKFPIRPCKPVTFRFARNIVCPSDARVRICFGVRAELSQQDTDIIVPFCPLGNRSKVGGDLRFLCIGRLSRGAQPWIASLHPLRALVCELEGQIVMERDNEILVVWQFQHGQ
jgi:hypothetical protein